MPGKNPPINIEVTEAPVATPKITIGIEGGIITPRDPAVVINASTNVLLYPILSMVGMTIVPTAATVAVAEPETAAKNMQTTTVTIASPPVILPKNTLHTFRILEDKPPTLIKSPAKINRGIASRGNESTLLTRA